MTKRLLVTIGVHAPKRMDVLPGVDAIVQRMAEYARRNPTYDDPIILSDAGSNRVTATDICAALTEEVLKNRPRILVHFCGHGARISGTEIWYLDDGLDQWSDRVDVMAFRDMLLSYGAKQVCIFSDACQTANSLLGNATPIIPKGNRLQKSYDVDMFRATIQGKAAFAAASGPLFSQVVLNALDQNPTLLAAFDEQYAAMGKAVVSSRSLSNYVREALPDLAAGEHKDQYAQMAPGLMFDKDDYVVAAPSVLASIVDKLGSALPSSPPLGSKRSLRLLDADSLRRFSTRHSTNHKSADTVKRMKDSLSKWRRRFWLDASRIAENEHNNGHLNNGHLLVCTHDNHGPGEIELHVPGRQIINGRPVKTSFVSSGHYFIFDVRKNALADLMHPAGVLQVGDQYVPLQLNVTRNMSMILSMKDFVPPDGAFGSDALGWYEAGFGSEQQADLHPMEALAGFLTGILGPDSIDIVTAQLRGRKHSDPLHGIVAAYLYDRVGDNDSIRRMCAFYALHGQQVPFDVAMLSRLPFRRGPSGFEIDVPEIAEDEIAKQIGLPEFAWTHMREVKSLAVSGFAPVLAMGWGRMATLLEMSPVMSELTAMRQHFSVTPFPACLGHHNGDELIELMNKFYNY